MRSASSPALRRALLGVLGLLLVAGPAPAQPRRARDGACKADVERLCPDVSRGGGAIHDCLTEHESELSPECREDLQRTQQRFAELKESCKDDVARYCADVEPGQGGLARCLRDHEADLSQSCKDALPERGGHRGGR
jgi:hypothetical protein